MVVRLAPHCRGALALLAAASQPDVAVAILDDIVASQWEAPGRPWDASFGGRPVGEVAWVDGWDPNLRSLVGVVLACAIEVLGPRPSWVEALVRAVLVEEALARLTPSYGNIAAAHTACAFAASAAVGPGSRADQLAGIGSAWLAAVEVDVDARGGWCEHASPTYAGVCLGALAGAAHWASSGMDRERAEGLARRAGQVIAAAWNPVVGDLVGPFGRAYHGRCADHVAVTGLALAGAGVTAAFPDRPARHPEDWGWAALLDHLGASAYVPAQPGRPAVGDVTGFGTISRFDSAEGPVSWGAVGGRPEDWHLQTVTASVHGGGAAAWLWHPALVAVAGRDGFDIDTHEPGDGHPDWLWGHLPRPPAGLFRPPDSLLLRVNRPPIVEGRRVEVPGAFALELGEAVADGGLARDGFGPPGYEVRLPLVAQRIGIEPLT